MTTRDLVRTEANERIDQPDFNFAQWASRSWGNKAWHYFVATETTDLAKYILRGFKVTASGSPDAQCHVANGIAIGSAILPDGTIEAGAYFGQDSPSTQAVDLSGQPVGTINVYIRLSLDAGVSGTRIFYNGTDETPGSINTRYVAGWDATFGTSSPGDEWILIGIIDWDGSTIVTGDITQAQNYLFEGQAGLSFASTWGGGSDRSTDRATNGIFSFKRWGEALRKQLTDIIGETHWYDLPNADLAEVRTHIDMEVDPHSDSPEWTGTVTAEDLAVNATATIETLVIGDMVDSDIVMDTGRQYKYADDRFFQNGPDWHGVCACVENDIIGKVGAWGAFAPGSIAGMEGEAGAPGPWLTLSSVTPGDYLDINMTPLTKAGCTLKVIVMAEANQDSIDLILRVASASFTGVGGFSTMDTDIQTIDDAGRVAVMFDLSGADFHGLDITPESYRLRIEVDSLTGSPTQLIVYGVMFRWAGDAVLKGISSCTAA